MYVCHVYLAACGYNLSAMFILLRDSDCVVTIWEQHLFKKYGNF